MQSQLDEPTWDLSPAINLLNTLSSRHVSHTWSENLRSGRPKPVEDTTSFSSIPLEIDQPDHFALSRVQDESLGLGDFDEIWAFFGQSADKEKLYNADALADPSLNHTLVSELETGQLNKGVRWRDELDGADLEDNVEPVLVDTAASLRTEKRTARRAQAKEKAAKLAIKSSANHNIVSDSATCAESGEELENLRRSPDRRAVIQNILRRPEPKPSPPTSPSPPKTLPRTPTKQIPITNPFIWSGGGLRSPAHRPQILPLEQLSIEARKLKLLVMLAKHFPDESTFLLNAGLSNPQFMPLNTSVGGIHVFVDISNVSHAVRLIRVSTLIKIDYDRIPRLSEDSS